MKKSLRNYTFYTDISAPFSRVAANALIQTLVFQTVASTWICHIFIAVPLVTVSEVFASDSQVSFINLYIHMFCCKMISNNAFQSFGKVV